MKKRKLMNLAAEDERMNFCNGFRSTCLQVSCCSSSIGSNNKRKASDLEGESVVNDTSSAERHKVDGSKRQKLVEFKSESDELETITPEKEKMPHEAELEQFFAEAQKDLNKRFKDKYNYDILNDIPIKGRFEWIQVKQGK